MRFPNCESKCLMRHKTGGRLQLIVLECFNLNWNVCKIKKVVINRDVVKY